MRAFIGVDQLFRQWHFIFHQVIPKHDDKRLLADESLRLQDSMSQSQRIGLTHKMYAHARRFLNKRQQLVLAFFAQVHLQLDIGVEMVLNGALAFACDDQDFFDA